jgi:uncharacterized cupin superfamily protein
MIGEARLEQSEAGLTPVTDGWFVVNLRDAAWWKNGHFGTVCVLEGEDLPDWDVGYTIGVFRPGETGGLYHREGNQEGFFVLSGECTLLVEGQERPLKAGDFFHCPAGTDHIIVGAGDGPCAIFMLGGRLREKAIVYPREEVALKHGAGVEEETPSPKEAYAPFPKWTPGPPESFAGLPWA